MTAVVAYSGLRQFNSWLDQQNEATQQDAVAYFCYLESLGQTERTLSLLPFRQLMDGFRHWQQTRPYQGLRQFNDWLNRQPETVQQSASDYFQHLESLGETERTLSGHTYSQLLQGFRAWQRAQARDVHRGARQLGFAAQVSYEPAIYDPQLGMVVYRRHPKGLSTRRMLNDARVLQNFGQWEALVSSLVSGVSSIGSAAVAAALAPHPAALTTASAPPPRAISQAPPAAAPPQVVVIPQATQVPPMSGVSVAASPQDWLKSPYVMIGGGIAFLALIYAISKR